jgi:GNAT superfamily N-acetyltransferase
VTHGDEAFLSALRAEPLPNSLEVDGFDCEEPDLTNYLTDGTAASEELAAFSRCYIVLTDAEEFVGYFNVLADSIRLRGRERPDGIRYSTAPAIKLGRMGVDKSQKRKGVGYWILDYVVGLAREISDEVGVRYVTLDALRKGNLPAWYAKYGFVENLGEQDNRDAIFKWFQGAKRSRLPSTVSMRYDILLQEEVAGEATAES